MKVLIACEFSGIVRDAFREKGHNAWSCDLLPSERPGPHLEGDVLGILDWDWDMMLAFPPCTYLASSGARYFKERQKEQEAAIRFVKRLLGCKIPKIAIENPIGVLSTKLRRPDQIIQPWQHGHGETKATCLWLKGLPKLVPSLIVDGRTPRVAKAPDSRGRWKNRSRTLPGVAKAMADQWS